VEAKAAPEVVAPVSIEPPEPPIGATYTFHDDIAVCIICSQSLIIISYHVHDVIRYVNGW
jgi:hypothetical protein